MIEPRYVEFRRPSTYSACADLCNAVKREFEYVADSLSLPDTDGRSVALRNISHLVGAATMILNVLDTGARSQEQLVRALLGLADGSTQVASEVLDKFNRIALLTLVQFQIENLLANLVRALESEPARKYARLVDQALGMTATRTRRASYAFLVPSWIRNTLHNNGIHEGLDTRVQMHGHRYVFRKGRRFSQAGWGEITHVFRVELRSIERLLYSPRVSQLKTVTDRYAGDVA